MSKSLKEIATDVRTTLKKEFPECKFSVRTEYYSMGQALHVSLMSAPFPVLANNPRGYAQINEFYINKDRLDNNGAQYTPEGRALASCMVAIANKDNWNRSDSQTDYYDVNYALSAAVGKWDKPFQITNN